LIRANAERLDSERWQTLYRRRTAVERELGRLKHAPLPLRVRGIERVQRQPT